ncbi:hypothetical protein AQ477_21715 [Burkholderia thailandensis]|nr:hypothetical protein AQ477_21715 [Burkholderia thailandensis]KXF58311.1 hypothetical protein AQ476_26830 [Burkholderia thailandensis]PNE76928.1 hypothetical protein A8H37_00375 [Burkholderia thailandensis]
MALFMKIDNAFEFARRGVFLESQTRKKCAIRAENRHIDDDSFDFNATHLQPVESKTVNLQVMECHCVSEFGEQSVQGDAMCI